MSDPVTQLDRLLRTASRELKEDSPAKMSSGELLATANVIDPSDVALFFAGVDAGLITLHRGGRFNTLDRPLPPGHWGLLSRSAAGGWYNAEYLPQIASYVDAILNLGYHSERVLFELPSSALQLDLAILDDDGAVVVLGEAKRDVKMLRGLREGIVSRFAAERPSVDSKKRGDEIRQLAWRIWTVAPRYVWLIAPGRRDAYGYQLSPLRLGSRGTLPPASELGLDHRPPHPPSMPSFD